jgi:hypothetical protein
MQIYQGTLKNILGEIMKKCYFCEVIKDLKEFYKDKSRKDGYCNLCKKCDNTYQKERKLNNKKIKKPSKKLDKLGKNFYVYVHYDNDETNIVYVGKGSGGRAWDTRSSTRSNNEHMQWMNNKILNNESFVKIIETKVISSHALELESLILSYSKPKFNNK